MVKKYGETETEVASLESLKSRQIVSEVMNFGVSQEQIIQIIKLLSLELEDRSQLLSINEACDVMLEGQNEIETGVAKIIS